MHLKPFIATLRGDRSLQRAAQAAMDAARKAWCREPGAEAMLREIEQFGAGIPIEACPMLERVFAGHGEAERLMHNLVRHYGRAMAAYPLGHPPFRHGFDGASSTMLLASSGRAQLLIRASEPGRCAHAGYRFSDAVRFDAVLSGRAAARIVRMSPLAPERGAFAEEELALSGGERFAFDLATEAFVCDAVEQRLVVLQLVRTSVEPHPTREFDAATGAFVAQTAAKLATSRQEAILALLGRMRRTDAADAMARRALTPGDSSLRWQALRECLALNSEAGFLAVLAIARDAGDPLAGPAGALRAQLLETHAEFADAEARACRG